jgi:hypothetical protein
VEAAGVQIFFEWINLEKRRGCFSNPVSARKTGFAEATPGAQVGLAAPEPRIEPLTLLPQFLDT